MRNKNNKHLGMEIAPDLHFKLRYISKYEGALSQRADCVSDKKMHKRV